ncbi:MAG: nuclear transport factor 2 family protein [Bacteriovorax sp.]|nr:nuclear transport factor 2 family protein [Bacteriovorax sp.]
MDQQINQTFEIYPHQYEENDVAETLNNFSEAIRNGNLNKIMSFYSEDIRAFDMMPPLEFNNKAVYQKRAWEDCFTKVFSFPVNYSYLHPKIELSGNIAFVYSLIHMSGDMIKGQKNVDTWLRNTTCLKKFGGQWLIIHEHMSVPVDNNMQAMMTLSPDGGNEAQFH